jgi:hypothetical protein
MRPESAALGEDGQVSDGGMRVPDRGADISELIELLAGLLEAAKRLPPGSERAQALEEIQGYQRRLGAILERFIASQIAS